MEALQKESEVPLEDLLKTLPSDILEKPASLPDEDELAEEEVIKHYLHKMCCWIEICDLDKLV